MRKFLYIYIIPILFFLISLVTLTDYGINWDEPIHWHRGQAYLHYYLTGEENYYSLSEIEVNDMPRYGKFNEEKKDYNFLRRSLYQDKMLAADHFLENDSGHPPVNGILASFTNYIFYQKLGLVGDIESYHLFNILASSLLVLVVSAFAYQSYGKVAAIASGASIALYPLFFVESKFNIKDPIQTAFYAATIWAFWNSLKNTEWKWMIFSSVFFALALGTKFNVLFLPFIILPYLVVRYGHRLKNIKKNYKKIPNSYILALLLSPIIIFGIFYATWPFLWPDPMGRLLEITKYYQDIGIGTPPQLSNYLLPGGFNLFPIFWVIVTTPPIILLLTLLGLVFSLKELLDKKSNEKTAVLFAIWFFIPILRVTFPGTSIYGGARQIMEYIPAVALLSGFGALKLYEETEGVKIRFILVAIIFVGFSTLIYNLYKIHPHQNVYFNFLVEGTKGAIDRGVPYAGNSFGNAYWDAAQWLNENAEEEARVALVQGTAVNLPSVMLRRDITVGNNFWSGLGRDGEYLLELTHNNVISAYPFAWNYIDKFLEPVYEVKADGGVIAKIWKNDWEHTKESMKKEEMVYKEVNMTVEDRFVTAKLSETKTISRFVIHFEESSDCSPVRGRVESTTDFINWNPEPDPVPYNQVTGIKSVDDGKLTYFLPGVEAKGVRFVADDANSCIHNNPVYNIYVLD